MSKEKRVINIILNLGNIEEKESSVRKMCVDEDNQVTNPNEILKEMQNFHDMLYGKKKPVYSG